VDVRLQGGVGRAAQYARRGGCGAGGVLEDFSGKGVAGIAGRAAFVARAAWRAAVDRLRGRAIQAGAASPERHEAEVGESAIEDLTSVGPNPEEAAMATDWEAAVHRLIDSLPEELRQPLVLSVEMNSREIAAAMGIAEGTVRTRLMRARQMLREKIAAIEERRYAER